MNDAYVKARREADKAIRAAVLKGQYPYLSALDEILPDDHPHSMVRLGTMEIPLSQIVGTKTAGRKNTFACNFMPAADPQTEFAAKWGSLYNYQETSGIQDPVLVFEYKHRFYVQEGNKRVSVMKYLDVPTILADVTRILPDEKDPLYEEFLVWYKATGLYEPEITTPGGYQKLADLLGYSLNQVWTDEQKRRLTALYYRFCKSAEKYGLEGPQGEAFLAFVSVYGLEGLRVSDETAYQKQFVRVKEALRKENRPAAIAVKPQEKKADPLNEVKKVLPLPLPFAHKPLRIAFLYEASPKESAAVFDHELGRIILEKRLGSKVQTDTYENCQDVAVLRKALTDASENHDVIITTFPEAFEDTYRAAVRKPERTFLNCSGNMTKNVLPVYDVRMYEAKFLLGALAAVFADSHRIAYLSEMPREGTIAEINAFAIGAAMIDPYAEIILSWKDQLDAEWQEQMKALDISVFSGTELPDLHGDSMKYGIWQLKDGNTVNLANPVINWGNYYTKLAESLLEGQVSFRASHLNYWWGMSAEVLDVRVSGSLPYSSRKLVQLLKNGLIHEKLNPFDGELHSQTGIIKGPYDAKLSNEEILHMQWLNDNIIGSLPYQQEPSV